MAVIYKNGIKYGGHTVIPVVQVTGSSTTDVMSQNAVTTALSGKQATLTTAQQNAVNSGITSNKVSTYDGYASQISSKENISNKVTTISASSTNTQYPSAKCVYDIVGNIESTLRTIRGVS